MAYQQPHSYNQQYQQPPQAPGPQQPHYGQGQGAPQHYPPPPHQQQLGPPSHGATGPASVQNEAGSFPGGSYVIGHRDTNSVLNITLQQGGSIKSKSGAMIHMAGTVQLTGKVKFSMTKILTGSALSESTYAGYGQLALGPTLFGDIITLHVDGREQWNIGKDAFLACTSDVSKENKTQGFGKAMFSGEDLFIYRVQGQGLMWLTSFGAVDKLTLQPGEQHIVDNGHLVAWSCDYKIERAGGGGLASLKTGEGLVCRFTGPGSIYIQTRNMAEFEAFIAAHARTN